MKEPAKAGLVGLSMNVLCGFHLRPTWGESGRKCLWVCFLLWGVRGCVCVSEI